MPESITFFLNGEKLHVNDVLPTKSVLNFLREDQQRKGTKEGCAEGDCGACTVVLAELVDNEVVLKNVNACIQFLATLDGKALLTVEYLRQDDDKLHPVQQALVDWHGSQCGFCTPGFVMSLWALYTSHQQAGSKATCAQIRSALTGNLCRCTGYKPIIDAASKMFDLPPVEFDFPRLKAQLLEIKREKAFHYAYLDYDFMAPKTVSQLLDLRAELPNATILSGGTDIGIWVNKQFKDLTPIVYVGEVNELKRIQIDTDFLHIGAAVSLSDAAVAINTHYPEMSQMWERFASRPIRNVGTLGGNIANGSPIGDSMPALIALETRIVLASNTQRREIPLQDFYLDYMKKDLAIDEILETIKIPLPQPNVQFRCYKLSKRYDSDISSVFAAFAIKIHNEKVEDIKIVFGGMAAIPRRANITESVIKNTAWLEPTAKLAMQSLLKDYSPLTDMRASKQNRMQSAQNLLYRFYLETRTENPLPKESLDVFNSCQEAI